jgi:hypothetical protein
MRLLVGVRSLAHGPTYRKPVAAPASVEQRERVQAAGCTAPEPRRHERAVIERAVMSRDDLLCVSSSEMLERLMDVHTEALGLVRDDHDDLDVLLRLAHRLPPGR